VSLIRFGKKMIKHKLRREEMINEDTFKWFIRGFLFTSLVLLVVVIVVRPTTGWAQGGSEEKPNSERPVIDDTPPHDPGTDDPTGRAPVTASSVVDSSEPRSNKAKVVDDAPPHDPGTDDPTGRAPVTAGSVVDSGEPHSNEAMIIADAPPHAPGTDDPAGDTAGIEAASEVAAQGYSSPLVIPAADFSDDGWDPDSFFLSFGGGYVTGTAAGYGCLKAPAYLPHGATVTSVYAYLYDNDGARSAYADLRRVRNMTGVQETMASVSTSGYANSTSIRYLGDTTISPNGVDNLYSYYVTTCVGSSGIRLYAVRIFYAGP
jgi:hypothetical protein